MSPSKNGAIAARLRQALGGHLATLDGVRGLAILLVLLHNLNVLSGRQTLAGHAFDFFDDFGWVGVQLFFVLSGFLITGVLLDTKTSDRYYRTFFSRRVLRIFPLYYATLFVAFVLAPLFTAHAPDGRHQIWLWTYLSNWAAPTGREVVEFPHFWSLAVEEQFYLVWPFVVHALATRRLLQLCVVLFLAAFAIRTGLRLVGVGPEPVYMWTICRMDSLAAGAAVAAALRLPSVADLVGRWRWHIGVAALFVAVAGFLVTRGNPRTTLLGQTLGYAILSLTFAVLVFAAVLAQLRGRGPLFRLLAFAPLRALGTYSYGMYVFHVPIHAYLGLPILRRLVGDESIGSKIGFLYMAAVTAITFVAAVISYHLFELPFLRLKRRFQA
jgi:peptidoglycan/LPS O-acetylase OafA/YrhL